MSDPHRVLDQIVKLGSDLRLLHIRYQKAPSDRKPLERIIEPYAMKEGKQDIMLHAWQQSGDRPGWRYFMVHKIIHVADAGVSFAPRRVVSLGGGEVETGYEPWKDWDQGVREYRDHVNSMLADLEVTPDEVKETKALRKKHKVSDELMRSVHTSIYSNCLILSLNDGKVDEQEVGDMRILYQCLSKLGYAPGE